jgi:hypothetical protein
MAPRPHPLVSAPSTRAPCTACSGTRPPPPDKRTGLRRNAPTLAEASACARGALMFDGSSSPRAPRRAVRALEALRARKRRLLRPLRDETTAGFGYRHEARRARGPLASAGRRRPTPVAYARLGMVTRMPARMLPLVNRAADAAPMAPACCNACRTCMTTNAVGLAVAAAAVAGAWVRRAVTGRSFSQ